LDALQEAQIYAINHFSSFIQTPEHFL